MKHILLFEICAREICEKFVYKDVLHFKLSYRTLTPNSKSQVGNCILLPEALQKIQLNKTETIKNK